MLDCRGEERRTTKPKSNDKEPIGTPENPEGAGEALSRPNNRQEGNPEKRGEGEIRKLEVQLLSKAGKRLPRSKARSQFKTGLTVDA